MNRMAGRGAFIDGVVASVVQYYCEILQNLTPWHAPPKELSTLEGPIEAEAIAVPEGIQQGRPKTKAPPAMPRGAISCSE